jgi:hypothetical protein
MKYDEIYYKAISHDETSTIGWGDNSYRVNNLNSLAPIVVDRMLYMKIKDNRKPLLDDFHSHPIPVFSQRTKEIIEQFSLIGNQFFPVTITHKDSEFKDCFIINCHNEVMAMHRERSKFQEEGLMYFIDSLSLDESISDKIPEEERMIFVLEEKASMILYHEKIVKALEAANITGVRFKKVKSWSIGSAFD